MGMIDRLDDAEACGSRLYGMWNGYKVPYLNGDVFGNAELLSSADDFDKANGSDISYTDISKIRGEFVWQLLKKLNEIKECDAKSLATKDNMSELLKIWTQQ